MPRANRHFLPGLVWHLTHRCHQREFLLKFSRDRDTYLHWLYEARKRFGLCVLDYMVTSNHVHLLVCTPAPRAHEPPRLVPFAKPSSLGRQPTHERSEFLTRLGARWSSSSYFFCCLTTQTTKPATTANTRIGTQYPPYPPIHSEPHMPPFIMVPFCARVLPVASSDARPTPTPCSAFMSSPA